MPAVAIPLSSTEFSVFNSIYYKIIQDVAQTIEVDPKTLTVLYKNVEYAKTDNETNASILTNDNRPTTVSKKRFMVRVNQEYDEDNLGSTAVHQEEHFPIFEDRTLGVMITPIYIQIPVELEFTYTSPSKSELNTMRDMIRIHLSRTRNIGHHEVEYTMLIPEAIDTFIEDIHKLRERLIPQSLGDYFMEHSTKRIHPITDMSNESNVRIGVKEKQVRIVGTYDFSPMPDKVDSRTEDNTNTFSFSYRFSVTIPRALSVRYPPMICNRMLPEKYLAFVAERRKLDFLERNRNINYIGHSNYALSRFEAHRQLENMVDINLPVNIPQFDEFKPRQGHAGYGIVMSFLIEVDETDKKTLFNLNDISPYQIKERVAEFIRQGDYKYLTIPYQSFMYLGLHQEGRHFDNSVLEIDADMTVRSKVELSLFKPVRVTLGLCIDITMLDSHVVARLQQDPDLFLDFLKEYLEVKHNFNELVKNQSLTEITLIDTIINYIHHNLSADNIEAVKDVLKVIEEMSLPVRDSLANAIVNRRPELTSRLEAIGIEFYKEQGRNSYRTEPQEHKMPPGTPILPFVIARGYGLFSYPEYI